MKDEKDITICEWHQKIKDKSILTEDEINDCLKCSCKICCNPMKYCECDENKQTIEQMNYDARINGD